MLFDREFYALHFNVTFVLTWIEHHFDDRRKLPYEFGSQFDDHITVYLGKIGPAIAVLKSPKSYS